MCAIYSGFLWWVPFFLASSIYKMNWHIPVMIFMIKGLRCLPTQTNTLSMRQAYWLWTVLRSERWVFLKIEPISRSEEGKRYAFTHCIHLPLCSYIKGKREVWKRSLWRWPLSKIQKGKTPQKKKAKCGTLNDEYIIADNFLKKIVESHALTLFDLTNNYTFSIHTKLKNPSNHNPPPFFFCLKSDPNKYGPKW